MTAASSQENSFEGQREVAAYLREVMRWRNRLLESLKRSSEWLEDASADDLDSKKGALITSETDRVEIELENAELAELFRQAVRSVESGDRQLLRNVSDAWSDFRDAVRESDWNINPLNVGSPPVQSLNRAISRVLAEFEMDTGAIAAAQMVPDSPVTKGTSENNSNAKAKRHRAEAKLAAIARCEKPGEKWTKETARAALEKMQKAEPKYYDALTTKDLIRIAGGSPHTFLNSGGPLPKAVLETKENRNSPKRKDAVGLTDGVLMREASDSLDPLDELIAREDLEATEQERQAEIQRLAKEQRDDDADLVRKAL